MQASFSTKTHDFRLFNKDCMAEVLRSRLKNVLEPGKLLHIGVKVTAVSIGFIVLVGEDLYQYRLRPDASRTQPT